MSEAFWALGRASGVVLLVLFTITMLLGILTRSGRPMLGLPRFAVTLVHRNIALLSVVFLAVHVFSLLADPYAQLRILDFVVPFGGAQKPFWLGLGTLSLDLMLAVAITGLVRNRIGRRAFKAVHWAAYASWPIAIAHGLGMGSDAGTRWFLVLVVVSVGLVVLAALWRTTSTFVEYRSVRVEEQTR